jgi:hypothetical protein
LLVAVVRACFALALRASRLPRVCLFVSAGEVKFNAMSSDASGRLR